MLPERRPHQVLLPVLSAQDVIGDAGKVRLGETEPAQVPEPRAAATHLHHLLQTFKKSRKRDIYMNAGMTESSAALLPMFDLMMPFEVVV